MSNVSPEGAAVNPPADEWTDGLLWALAQRVVASAAAARHAQMPPPANLIRFPVERARPPAV